jgi:hypothetical protein
MPHRQFIDVIMQSIGVQLETSLELDADGTVTISYGEGFVCMLVVDDRGSVLASTPVALVDQESRQGVFETALRLNGSGGQTQAAIIGYDPVHSQLELSRRFFWADSDVEGVSTALGDFLHDAIALRAILAEAGRQQATSPASLTFEDAAGMMRRA